jgi:hypothetical protein
MARLATTEEVQDVIRLVIALEEHDRRIAEMTDDEFEAYQQRQIELVERRIR